MFVVYLGIVMIARPKYSVYEFKHIGKAYLSVFFWWICHKQKDQCHSKRRDSCPQDPWAPGNTFLQVGRLGLLKKTQWTNMNSLQNVLTNILHVTYQKIKAIRNALPFPISSRIVLIWGNKWSKKSEEKQNKHITKFKWQKTDC